VAVAATAQSAGLGAKTRVHGVGDVALWIMAKFQENFGAQGRYLLDFYPVSEYLAAAATVIKPKHPTCWRQCQQGRLLENKVAVVLRALTPHRESETAENQPVNAAYQYLHKRREHLDYAGARRQALWRTSIHDDGKRTINRVSTKGIGTYTETVYIGAVIKRSFETMRGNNRKAVGCLKT